LRDEIVMLKTRIAELEGTLMDERCAKEVKLETTIKGYKDSMQGQYLDYKLKLDEYLMIEKEKNNKLRLETHRQQEELQEIKKKMMAALIKIEDLEKENFNLHNEIDKAEIQPGPH